MTPDTALDTLLDALFDCRALPPATIARAETVVLDSIGAICAGLALPENQALRAAAPLSSEATVIGRAAPAPVEWATLVHGTAGTATELDEGHAPARGHPGIHVLPLALALSEAQSQPGHELLRAFVLGYEVAARTGVATTPRPGVHPHGTWGTLGAAMAAGLLLDLDRAALGQAVRVAADLSLAPSFRTATEGASVRNAFAGVSGQLGLTAARLAAAGFTGLGVGPAEVYSRILGSSRFDPQALVEGLGERWEIERGYFKVHACCRYNHAALDALLTLQARTPFTVEEIEGVEVATYASAAQLRNPEPATPLAARFSLPFAVATALVTGTTAPVAFEPEAIAEPRTRELARRVHVSEEAEFTAMGPSRRPARVTVTLRDGRRLSETVYGSKGDPDDPVTGEELSAKFERLSAPVLGRENVARLAEATRRLHELPSVRLLTHHLRPTESELARRHT